MSDLAPAPWASNDIDSLSRLVSRQYISFPPAVPGPLLFYSMDAHGWIFAGSTIGRGSHATRHLISGRTTEQGLLGMTLTSNHGNCLLSKKGGPGLDFIRRVSCGHENTGQVQPFPSGDTDNTCQVQPFESARGQ